MNELKKNISSIYCKEGKQWLVDNLLGITSKIAKEHNLSGLAPVNNMTFNYVASGQQGDKPIILKASLDSEGLAREAFALKCFAGYGAVKVLAEDNCILLLERAMPGASLKSYFPDKEQESIKIACGVIKKLHQANIPTPHNFLHIKDWLTALDNDWNIPNHYLQKARRLRNQLLQISKPDVFLHGDLHHDNILQNGDDWVVIDPKCLIGSPMNEIWAFVMDIERDIPFIAQYFNYRTQDLFDWYFVHVILAACWNLEDNIDTNLFLRLAEKAYKYAS